MQVSRDITASGFTIITEVNGKHAPCTNYKRKTLSPVHHASKLVPVVSKLCYSVIIASSKVTIFEPESGICNLLKMLFPYFIVQFHEQTSPAEDHLTAETLEHRIFKCNYFWFMSQLLLVEGRGNDLNVFYINLSVHPVLLALSSPKGIAHRLHITNLLYVQAIIF